MPHVNACSLCNEALTKRLSCIYTAIGNKTLRPTCRGPIQKLFSTTAHLLSATCHGSDDECCSRISKNLMQQQVSKLLGANVMLIFNVNAILGTFVGTGEIVSLTCQRLQCKCGFRKIFKNFDNFYKKILS